MPRLIERLPVRDIKDADLDSTSIPGGRISWALLLD